MNNNLLQKYVLGEATTEEKREVLSWLAEDEKNIETYQTLRRITDLTIWQEKEIISSSVKYSTGWMKKAGWITGNIAAVIVVAFFIHAFFQKKVSQEPVTFQTLHVPAGQRAELVLMDGTRVWLNAMSTLTFPSSFRGNRREVELSGEGFFHTVKNSDNPFVVKAGEYSVKALGTEFNVFAYDNISFFGADLLEGKIEVSALHWEKPVILEPNTRLSEQDGNILISGITSRDYYLWKEGIFYFDDEPFYPLLTKLRLYYDVEIDIQNERLLMSNVCYTGKVRIKDGVEHALKVLQLKTKFRYEKIEEDNKFIIR